MLLTGSLLAATGCKKTGPQGPAGKNGVDGNANVIGTDAFTVQNWTQSGNQWTATFNDADITPSIVDHGIVQIFKSYGTNDWTNLPDVNGQISTVFDFFDGGFEIYVQSADGTLPAYPGNQIFRTVIISASKNQANPNTNWKNYNEVMTALNGTPAKQAPVSAE